MAAAIASGLIRQKRQAREQHLDRPSTNRRRKSPNKNKGLCNGNLVDIFAKVRIFGLRKRRLRRQGVSKFSVNINCMKRSLHLIEVYRCRLYCPCLNVGYGLLYYYCFIIIIISDHSRTFCV